MEDLSKGGFSAARDVFKAATNAFNDAESTTCSTGT